MPWHTVFSTLQKNPEVVPKNPCLFAYLSRFFGGATVLLSTLASLPSQAAEQIVLHYGPIQIPIKTSELQTYLTGPKNPSEIPANLPPLAPRFEQKLRQVLTQPLPPLSSSQIDHLFSAPSGQMLLQKLGELLQSEPGQNGAIALKQALIHATQDPQGLNGLSLLRAFPGDLHINAREGLALLQRQQQLQQTTARLLEKLDNPPPQGYPLAAAEHWAQGPGRAQPAALPRPDPRSPGTIAYDWQTLALWDDSRDRPVTLDLYRPERGPLSSEASPPKATGIPLLLMSHGLAADRRSRDFFAQHLASHGIAVAMVQHAGSDSAQFQALLQGEAKDIAEVQSFVDRPQDLSFAIDELERRNHQLFGGQLRTEQVIVFGHSFGAYTALALAGAELDLATLQRDCPSDALLLNLSLALQCLARDTVVPPRSLQDDRVAALLLFDPVSSHIFGPTGLAQVSVPVLWSGSQQDSLTPLAISQLPSFNALGSGRKYLMIAEATNHIHFNPQATAGQVLEDWIVPHPPAITTATNALGLAFVACYGLGDHRYQSYLQADYAQRLSQGPHQLHLLSAHQGRWLALQEDFSLEVKPDPPGIGSPLGLSSSP